MRSPQLGGSLMPFEKSVLVPLSADETFALITEPDRLRRWQTITARVDLRAGGDYRWTIIPGHSARGTFTEVEPGRRVVFTWGGEGDAGLPPGGATARIHREPSAAARSLGGGVAAGAERAVEGWNLGGLDGAVKVGSNEMPAAAALGIGSIELLVHAWDFAQATGQQVRVPEGLSTHVLEVAGQIITPEVRSGGGFADAVPTGPDANVMDRLIAFTGRNVPAGRTASS